MADGSIKGITLRQVGKVAVVEVDAGDICGFGACLGKHFRQRFDGGNVPGGLLAVQGEGVCPRAGTDDEDARVCGQTRGEQGGGGAGEGGGTARASRLTPWARPGTGAWATLASTSVTAAYPPGGGDLGHIGVYIGVARPPGHAGAGVPTLGA